MICVLARCCARAAGVLEGAMLPGQEAPRQAGGVECTAGPCRPKQPLACGNLWPCGLPVCGTGRSCSSLCILARSCRDSRGTPSPSWPGPPRSPLLGRKQHACNLILGVKGNANLLLRPGSPLGVGDHMQRASPSCEVPVVACCVDVRLHPGAVGRDGGRPRVGTHGSRSCTNFA